MSEYDAVQFIEMIIPIIHISLSDDLLTDEWKKRKTNSDNELFGHCYIASECIYHLLKILGYDKFFTPYYVRLDKIIDSIQEKSTHWYLKSIHDDYIDPTAEQFKFEINSEIYDCGKGCDFLTKEPSKRTTKLIERIYSYYGLDEELTKIIRDVKELLIEQIRTVIGIERKITIKIKPFRKERNEWVGLYRCNSQFRHTGIIFWINDDIKRIFMKYPHDTLFDVVYRTLLHEYGHVMYEYAKKKRNDMYLLINDNFDDEEDFAEEFMRFICGDSFVDESVFEQIIEIYYNDIKNIQLISPKDLTV